MQTIVEGNIFAASDTSIEISQEAIVIRGRFISSVTEMRAAGVLELVGCERPRGLRRVVVAIARWLLRR